MKSRLFTESPSAMLLIDPIRNRILQANQQAQSILMLTNEWQKLTVTQLFNMCLPELTVFTQQVIEQGQGSTNHLKIKIKEKIIYLDVNAKTLLSDEHVFILLSLEDSQVGFKRQYQIAAQTNYESGLFYWQQSESLFQDIEKQNKLILSAAGDGIYGIDAQGCTTFVNEAAEQILGWSKVELIGQKIHDVIHHTHQNGQHYHVHDCPIYAAFNDGTVHRVDDEVFWSRQGNAIAVEYTSTPVTDGDKLMGAVVVFRDISERKQTEQKLLNALKEVDALKNRLELENAYLIAEINADFNHQQIVGKSAVIQNMIHQIELVGATDANVLIIGESGTGKELIARAIHEGSPRKNRPLIRVNCAAIPTELFESEFFGHVKGAFSGAISDRIGRFELADDATIFLDEVGEIPLQLQGKLLRVLQEQQFERVGESLTRHVNVRVIAATNQNLKQLVKDNKFREDLYFRLNVFPIHSPPLRDRIDDLPLLVKYFIHKICMRFNQPEPSVSVMQMQNLMKYHWPGNIRELENTIERQVILAKENKLNFNFLIEESNRINQPEINHIVNEAALRVNAAEPVLINAAQQKQLEKQNLENALAQCKGKIYGENGAAALLGIKPTTLSSRLKKYGINRQNFTLANTATI